MNTTNPKIKCNGNYSYGYEANGFIYNGGIKITCNNKDLIIGNWTSSKSVGNIDIGAGSNQNDRKFYFIVSSEIKKHQNLINDLKSKILTTTSSNIEKPKGKDVNKINSLKILSTGTGFFISNNGYILTNAHVISNSSKVSLFINGEIIDCEVIMSDTNNDIALLKANINSKAIPISKSNINKGASISAFGFPLVSLQGNELKVTFGNINSLSGIKNDFRFYQIDTPIQPGNSGGPLINKYGEVIGIVSSALSQDYTFKNSGVLNQNVNYAIKIDYSLPILKQFNVKTDELHNKVKLDNEQLVKKYENSVVIVISQGF